MDIEKNPRVGFRAKPILDGATLPEVVANSPQVLMGAPAASTNVAPKVGFASQAPALEGSAGAIPFKSGAAGMMRGTREADRSITSATGGLTGPQPMMPQAAPTSPPTTLTASAGEIPFKSDTASMIRGTREADKAITGVTGVQRPQPSDATAGSSPFSDTRVVMRGFAEDGSRNISEGNYGALVGNTIKATAAMPVALAADVAQPITSRLEGVGRGMVNAASTLFGGSESAGSTPGANNIASLPASTVTAATPAGVNPELEKSAVKASAAATPAATPAAPVNPNLVTRVGNSYSGGPNISGDIELAGTRGGVISAQNNQAAENLARSGGQTRGFGPAGAIRGGGQVSSMDTSAGYAADLKQLADIQATKAEQNANIQGQADYAAMKAGYIGPKTYQAILARNQIDATTRRGQDIQATSVGFTNKLAQEKLGLDKAKDGREATSAGFTSRSAQRREDLQTAYEKAKPEDRPAIAEQIRVFDGKDRPAHWKTSVLQGIKNVDGSTSEGSIVSTNEQTGEVKRLDQAPQVKVPHAQDIARLNANPKEAAMFEQIYGAGSAKQYLGKQ